MWLASCVSNGAHEHLDAFACGRMADGHALALGREHADQLAAAQHQRLQVLLLGVGQRLHEALALGVRCDDLSQLREHARIDRIGLGQLPHRLGKVARLARVDQRHRYPRRLQRAGQRKLIAPARFEHHQRHLPLAQPCNDGFVIARLIGEVLYRTTGPNSQLQGGFCDIDTCVVALSHVLRLPSLCYASSAWLDQPFGLCEEQLPLRAIGSLSGFSIPRGVQTAQRR